MTNVVKVEDQLPGTGTGTVVGQTDGSSRQRDALSLSKNALEDSKHSDGRWKANDAKKGR